MIRPPNPIRPYPLIDRWLKPPYPPRPRPNKIPWKRPMTIAAGFRFSGGILLCADTEATYGPLLKLSSSKIFPIDYGVENGILCFVIAGSVDYAVMAIEKIRARVWKSDFSHTAVKEIIKSELLAIYNDHIYIHPHYSYGTAPTFNLLTVFWTLANYLSFWKSEETSVTNVKNYECIGAGAYLAKYLADPVYKHDSTREEIVSLTIEILRDAKDYVPSCGKNSDFLILDDDGMFGYVSAWDISSQEDYGRIFNSALRSLWFRACDPSLSNKQIETEIVKFSQQLADAREDRKGMLEDQRKLIKKMVDKFLRPKKS